MAIKNKMRGVKETAGFIEIGGKKYIAITEEAYDRMLDALDAVEAKRISEDDSIPAYKLEDVLSGLITNRISEARKGRGLSQRDLAVRMRIAQSTLSRIEKQGANITLSTLKKAAAAIGCPVAELI